MLKEDFVYRFIEVICCIFMSEKYVIIYYIHFFFFCSKILLKPEINYEAITTY